MSLRAPTRSGGRGRGGSVSGAALSCLSLAALGVGLMQAIGYLTDTALLLVILSLVLAVLALRSGLRMPGRGWWVATTVIAGLTNLLYPQLGGPFAYHVGGQIALTLALTAMAGAACALRSGRAATVLVAGAGLCLLALMAVTSTWGLVRIDVFTAVTGATRALLHGANPYSPVFNMRLPQYPWWVHAHFVYGPIVPFLSALGWLVGDVRVSCAAALAVTFLGLWLLARQGGHRLDAHRIVALAIASPLNVGMVTRGWVEIYIVAGVVLWLALRGSRRRLATVSLGIAMLVSPLTLLMVLPGFIWSRRARREVAAAVIGAVVFAIPFALITGVGAFLSDIVGFQLSMPMWPTALTVTAFAWQSWHLALSSLVTGAVVLIAVAVIAWRGRPAQLGEVAVQTAVLLLATFLFAKWAFFNEYFMVSALLLAGLAGAEVALPVADVALPDPRNLRRLAPRATPRVSAGPVVDATSAPFG